MVIYWDTSCVLKLYTPEADSEDHVALAERDGGQFVSGEILTTELFIAFRRKEDRGDIKPGSADILYRRFLADVHKGRLALLAVGQDVCGKAVEIARDCYNRERPVLLRSLDAIHLATACLGKCAGIVTSDRRMLEAAPIVGLSVVKPWTGSAPGDKRVLPAVKERHARYRVSRRR